MPDPDAPGPLAYATPPGLDPREPEAGRPILRRPFAYLLVVLFVAAFLIVLMPGSGPHSRETANRIKCAANLRSIGQSMSVYANANGGAFPDDLETLLLTQDLTPPVFVCPSSDDTPAVGTTPAQQAAALGTGGHLSYVYAAAGRRLDGPADAVLIFEAAPHPAGNSSGGGGMDVLFGDGHVAFVNADDSRHLLNELAAGHNPPRPAVAPVATPATP